MFLNLLTATSGSPAAAVAMNASTHVINTSTELIRGRRDRPSHEPRDKAAMATRMAAAGGRWMGRVKGGPYTA